MVGFSMDGSVHLIQRDEWMGALRRTVELIRRIDVAPPTLAGLGRVHDHYVIGRVLGFGRFGVVSQLFVEKFVKIYCWYVPM